MGEDQLSFPTVRPISTGAYQLTRCRFHAKWELGSSQQLHERHKQLGIELEALLPRGAEGSPQNILRTAFYDHRLKGRSFTESFDKALDLVRKSHPKFIPNIRFNTRLP